MHSINERPRFKGTELIKCSRITELFVFEG